MWQFVKTAAVAALLALLAAAVLSVPASFGPFNDVADYERWGWCEGFATAEECEDGVTGGMVYRHWLMQGFMLLFPFFLLLVALWQLMCALWRKLKKTSSV